MSCFWANYLFGLSIDEIQTGVIEMSEKTQTAIFAREVQRRLDELINWIVENSPDKNNAFTKSDFVDVRQNIYRITSGDNNLQHIEPEPEEGGAQYINDNPAPWP